jgi:NAD(P)-dependent dehydrogenase (short-subunit alcohol dehydrogenase family)
MPRAAIVTGGASGIGRALGAALVRRGDQVVLADIEGAAAEEVAEQLTALRSSTAPRGGGRRSAAFPPALPPFQTANSWEGSWKALNSSALPEGSRKNIVHCSPGSPWKRT